MTTPDPTALVQLLLERLRGVQAQLGLPPAAGPDERFADALDSMGLVEFQAVVAEDLGVSPEELAHLVGHRFGTVKELALTLARAGLSPLQQSQTVQPTPAPGAAPTAHARVVWLSAVSLRLPEMCQESTQVDALLGREAGWLEQHAGIRRRRLWGEADPLAAAAEAARACLQETDLRPEDVSVLLVTSEAPPVLVGLAAALHHRLTLAGSCPALEVGGACTGLVAALWTGSRLLPPGGHALILSVEAPSRWLALGPGAPGENAALFGDGAAACLLSACEVGPTPLCLREVVLRTDGSRGDLIRVEATPGRDVRLHLQGQELARQAVETLAGLVRELARGAGLALEELGAVVVHGGNGRLPGILARTLGLPAERVWSETANTGNLGSASLPAAWVARGTAPPGPVVWAAVGAGLQAGAALLAPPPPGSPTAPN